MHYFHITLRSLLTLSLFILGLYSAYALSGLSPDEAINHVGDQATVCGTVASAKYAKRSNGQPTFLNLDRPYPRHVFTAVIWGENRSRFSYAPETLQAEDICVQGTIETYKGKAQIIVDDPSQISR